MRMREVGIAGTSAIGLGPPNALVGLGGHERRVAVDGPGTGFARARGRVDDARRVAEVVDRRQLLQHAAVDAVAADAGRRPREVVRARDDAVAAAGQDPPARAAGVERQRDAVVVLGRRSPRRAGRARRDGRACPRSPPGSGARPTPATGGRGRTWRGRSRSRRPAGRPTARRGAPRPTPRRRGRRGRRPPAGAGRARSAHASSSGSSGSPGTHASHAATHACHAASCGAWSGAGHAEQLRHPRAPGGEQLVDLLRLDRQLAHQRPRLGRRGPRRPRARCGRRSPRPAPSTCPSGCRARAGAQCASSPSSRVGVNDVPGRG